MIARQVIDGIVQRATLAPSVHNTQPARWLIGDTAVTVYCDTRVAVPVADPDSFSAGLSCGAAVEAFCLAAAAEGLACAVDDLWTTEPDAKLRPAAHITLTQAPADHALHDRLEARFTWRGLFDPAPDGLFGWTRADALLVTDQASQDWLAAANDWASWQIMQNRDFRLELLSWMRLTPRHPRSDIDGMNRATMGMSARDARLAGWALGPLWPVLHILGRTQALTAEAVATRSAGVVAVFHRPAGESPITTGRAYLRLWLEATSLGMAGWPMAALADHTATRADICVRYGIASDRRLVQCIRFGRATGPQPPRARRPLDQVLIDG